MADAPHFNEVISKRLGAIRHPASKYDIEDLSNCILDQYIEAVKVHKNPDLVRREMLYPLALEASLEAMIKGEARAAVLFAALPVLFHNGRDPEPTETDSYDLT